MDLYERILKNPKIILIMMMMMMVIIIVTITSLSIIQSFWFWPREKPSVFFVHVCSVAKTLLTLLLNESQVIVQGGAVCSFLWISGVD